MMRSEFLIVDSLCAITSVVLPVPRSPRALWTLLSVLESSADVASSSNTIGGSFNRHRAMATLCFSPPLNFSPLSPTLVSHCSGSPRMKSKIWAWAHAFSICSMVAFIRPYLRLCRMLSLNMTAS
mmetsp:Transcript_1233/g.1447  ORF Transcript_1233/g.1447 Transcript_1233/m.1447 type:complete len:125 (-) Transcript_1233:1811-2185(-)